MLELVLLLLCLVSIVYCCDAPVIKGFEVFVNNHDSMLYNIGLSIIASYIFYVFQVLIPRVLRFRRTRNIGRSKLYEVEKSMTKVFSYLQGEAYNPEITVSKELIKNHLEKINIFMEKSRYEIQNHKEFSVFEALTYYDKEIIMLTDEIVAGEYIKNKYEKILFALKISKFHEVLERWKNNLPGEYEHYNADSKKENRTGYNWVNIEAVNSDIISSIDEYLSIYNRIKKVREKLYQRIM